jgi:anaphase-promoting complex subunit 4
MADEGDHAEAGLPLLAEKSLQSAVKPNAFAYCPTLDLLALATHEERVYVYRLNGQRVVGAGAKKQALKVQSIRWKPTGEIVGT